MNKGDKVIWNWISGNAGIGLRLEVTNRILPHSDVWAWVFERNASGGYVRAERALLALKKRSKAYRLQGVVVIACAEAAVTDLAGLMGRPNGKRVERC